MPLGRVDKLKEKGIDIKVHNIKKIKKNSSNQTIIPNIMPDKKNYKVHDSVYQTLNVHKI